MAAKPRLIFASPPERRIHRAIEVNSAALRQSKSGLLLNALAEA